MPSRRIILSGDSERSPMEQDATCDECGAPGTVGRATCFTTPPTVLRFCRRCWPAARPRLEAAWSRTLEEGLGSAEGSESQTGEGSAGYRFESRAWGEAVEFLARIEAALATGARVPTPADLARLAAQIQALTPEMDGPAPPEVAAFIRRYGSPAG